LSWFDIRFTALWIQASLAKGSHATQKSHLAKRNNEAEKEIGAAEEKAGKTLQGTHLDSEEP